MKSFNPKSIQRKRWGSEKIYYMSHYLFLHKFKKIAYLFKYINMMIFRNFIPPEVKIGKRLDLPHGGFGVIMHKKTIIGDDAVILHNVTIADGDVQIGNRVYIGTGAIIVGPAKIGDDVIIGANTFVNFNVPNGSTVIGQKGRIVMNREMNIYD